MTALSSQGPWWLAGGKLRQERSEKDCFGGRTPPPEGVLALRVARKADDAGSVSRQGQLPDPGGRRALKEGWTGAAAE